MEAFQKRFYALGKPDHIAVKSFQADIVTLMLHFDDINSTNSTGFRTNGIKITHHSLLVWNGNVESFQFRI